MYIPESCATDTPTALVQFCQSHPEKTSAKASAEEVVYHYLIRVCDLEADDELLIQLCNEPVPGQARVLRGANGAWTCDFGIKASFIDNLPQAMADLCVDVPPDPPGRID